MENNAVSFPTKIKLYRSFVLSVLLCECESWTLTAELQGRIQAFGCGCNRRMLSIPYIQRITNEYVWQRVDVLGRRQELLLSSVASYYGSVMSVVMICCRRSYNKVRGRDGSRRPRKSCKDNIQEQMSMLCVADDRGRWVVIAADASVGVSPTTPGR